LFVQLILWPRYISQVVGVPVWHYIYQGWVRPVLAVIPFGVACYFSDRYWPATALMGFFSQIAAFLPVYLVFVTLVFWSEIGRLFKLRTKLVSEYSGV